MSWTISILEAGVIPKVPLAVYLPGAPPGEHIDPPCFCYLVSDGSRVVLVDTGPDRARAARAGLRIEGDTTVLLSAALRRAGVKPADVSLIVHTHLHYDHMQNDLLFPNAEVMVQRAELDWACAPGDGPGPYYIGVAEMVEALGDRLRPADGRQELGPGLTALPNGGHTPGHQSVLAETASGPVCVCGDIVPLWANLTVVGDACPDRLAAESFLATARAAGWDMLPSHEPRLREHKWYVTAGPGEGPRGAGEAG